MSFRKPQAQSGKFQRWEKVLALRTIDALPKKPGGKRYSNPELAEIVTKTLKRPMTKETIRKWLKNRETILNQPEALEDSGTRKVKQCHLLPGDEVEFELEMEHQFFARLLTNV